MSSSPSMSQKTAAPRIASMTLKILVVSGQWFPDSVGGTGRVARATAEALVRKGHEVVALVPRAHAEPRVCVMGGVQVLRALRRNSLPLTFTDIHEVRRAIRTLQLDRFDVILTHGDGCTVAALSMRQSLPVALVYHASGYRESQYRRSGGLAPIEKWRALALEPFLYMLERTALRRADRILVLSEFSRSLVLDGRPDADARVHVVGGGVDTDFFRPARNREALRQRLGLQADQIILLTARRLVSRMGVEMLLDAFCELKQRIPKMELVIIGDGELQTQLEDHRDCLGCAESVRFLGRVSDASLRDWYQAADLFVLPTVAYEGFGMVTAEALACGTPVVGTRVGATAEILAYLDKHLLADAPDAASLARAMGRALETTDTPYRARCRSYAIARLDWDAVIRRWEAALVDLV